MPSGSQTYNWTVRFDNLNSSLPNIFFFQMHDNNNADRFFSTHYFNVTGDAKNAAAPSSTSAPNSTASSTTSPSPTSSSDSSLSSGAKAGIGVGVAVGAIAILALAGAMVWYKKKASRVHHEEQIRLSGVFPEDRKQMSNSSSPPGYSPAEMGTNRERAEMANHPLPKRRPTAPQELP